MDNKEQRRQWATWLHQELEAYEVPRELVGKENVRGDLIPASLYPVFRDEEELPADADLTKNIKHALEQSNLLVVLCSPVAVVSNFVADEIRYFKNLGKADRILALMIYGEPNASDDPGKARLGIKPELECFPQPLRYGVPDDSGKIDWNQRAEPIAADVRPEGHVEQGWTTGAAYREALQKSGKVSSGDIAQKVREYEKRLELAKLKVIAGALGVPLGELTRRDKAMQLEKARKRARALKLWLAAVGVLAILAVAGGIYASFQRKEAIAQRQVAESQKKQAVQTLARSDFLQAVQLIRQQKEDEALPYLARSLRFQPADNPAATMIFSLLAYRTWPDLQLMFSSSAQSSTATNTAADARIMTSNDGTLRFWDTATGLPLTPPVLHGVAVRTAVFSPDGSRIATATLGAGIYDAATGQSLLSVLPHDNAVRNVSFNKDGSKLATASEDNTARVWDTKTGLPLTELLPHQSIVYTAQLSPDETRVVTASFDRTARVWDVKTSLPVTGPLVHGDAVRSAVFSPDGSQVLTASFDSAAHLWDIKTEKEVFRLQHQGLVYVAVYSPDGKRILTASSDQTAMLWDAKTGQQLLKEPIQHNGAIYSARFSPDGSRIVTASGDRTARVWDASTGEPITPPLKHDDAVESAAFSPDGTRIVTASDDGTARIWDATTNLQLALPLRHDGYYVYTAAFSPDGSRILTMADDGVARVWDARVGQAYTFVPTPMALLTNRAAAFSALKKTAAPDANIMMMSHGSMLPLVSVPSPDHALNALFADDFITVKDAKTGQTFFQTNLDSRITTVTFSPNNSNLVVILGNRVGLYDPRTGKLSIPVLQHSSDVLSATFNPDNSRILTVSRDGGMCVWNTSTGNLAFPPLKNKGNGFFSPDGSRILTASGEIVSAANGLSLTIPMAYESFGPGTFSPDGLQFVAKSESVQTLDLPPNGETPDWLPQLAEAVARHQMDDLGNIKEVPFDQIKGAKTARLTSMSNDPWEKFGRWFFSEPDARTVSPWSQMTAPDYIQQCIAGYDKDVLIRAKALAYGHPDETAQITARIAQIVPPPEPPSDFRIIFTPDK